MKPFVRIRSYHLLALAAVWLSGCATTKNQIDPQMLLVKSGTSEALEPHVGSKRMSSYLSMKLAFAPADKLRQGLDKKMGTTLKHRDEAHITVITPVEYDQSLRDLISMDEINEIALREKMQSAAVHAVCVGRGSAKLDDKLESTYFLVVTSEDLLKLRRMVRDQANLKAKSLKKSPTTFDPDHFYPHVTLGFTKSDLHEANGVIKDARSCIEDLGLFVSLSGPQKTS